MPSKIQLTRYTTVARRIFSRLVLGAGLASLSGCASVYLVDNQVQAFSRWSDATAAAASVSAPQPPQQYRFERLPSQREGAPARFQDELDTLARAALAQRGWTLADPALKRAPEWTVQVSASALRLPRAPWDDPWPNYWGPWGAFPGRDYVVTGRGQVIWTPMLMHMDMPYYQREVALMIRQASSGRVVYETRAAHDGRWHDSPEIWSAMLEAALKDFPQAQAGVRQVNIEVPR